MALHSTAESPAKGAPSFPRSSSKQQQHTSVILGARARARARTRTRARPRARASLWQSEASLASAEALLAARLGAVRGARGGARVLGQEAAAGAADQGGALAQGITDDFDQEEDSDLGSDGFEP